MSDETRADRS